MIVDVVRFKKHLSEIDYIKEYRGLNFVLLGVENNEYVYQVWGSDTLDIISKASNTMINKLSSDENVVGFDDKFKPLPIGRYEYISSYDLDPDQRLTITINNVTVSYKRMYKALGTDGREYYIYVLDEVVT